jgi:signal transduction histidine kinase/phage shock protein PspC (stress-responsive transcriptional regulator)
MPVAELTPPRLARVPEGRLVAGVARGLGLHLGVDPLIIRIAFVLLTFASGAGAVMYAAFWAFVPLTDDPTYGAGRRLWPKKEPEPVHAMAAPSRADQAADMGRLIALATLALGVILVLNLVGVVNSAAWGIPLVLGGVGVAVLWRQADDAQRARLREAAGRQASAGGRIGWGRTLFGIVLVVAGLIAFLLAQEGISAAANGLLAVIVVLTGAALVAGPWLFRLGRELSAERVERVRSQERAEIAAHVHDSVLQTLTLIQRASDDPKEVIRLARAEERSLRGWLYKPTASFGATFSSAVETIAAEVEDAHRTPMDVVVVGDCSLDAALEPLLRASREAMVNAAKYAAEGGPVSVYAEVTDDSVELYVRDRGPGFDVDGIPDDRMGVRQSIVGRMERGGGTATIRSTSDQGTEVRLQMARAA